MASNLLLVGPPVEPFRAGDPSKADGAGGQHDGEDAPAKRRSALGFTQTSPSTSVTTEARTTKAPASTYRASLCGSRRNTATTPGVA